MKTLISFSFSAFRVFLIGALPVVSSPALGQSPHQTEDILVTADFRSPEWLDLSASVSVLDEQTIQHRSAEHLSDLVNLAPNLNFSGGTSRARFFQIRGIGERSQFVEPINPSVGLIIDGVDMTGIAGGATTLDIQQVEVLRGPQGTLHGANALAGLINMVSGEPTSSFESRLETRLAEYNTRTVEGVVSGPLSKGLTGRVAFSDHASDGYQDNAFLGADDTANRDEQTLRTKLEWQPNEQWKLGLSAFYLDLDNGYDAFSLDNTRTTLSDQPGHDRQRTGAGSLRLEWQPSETYQVVSLLSHADSDLEYGYDEDWTFEGLCESFTCVAEGYKSFDNYRRVNRNTTADLRLMSLDEPGEPRWVLGAYWRDQVERLRRDYTYLTSPFHSDFATTNQALYGQLDLPLAQRLTLVTGLRRETRRADYADSAGASHSPSEHFWGGKLALEYRTGGRTLLYGLVSRGYKAGGFNSDQDLPDSERRFAGERLWNYELGIKGAGFNQRLQASAAWFYQDRGQVQTKQSLVQPIEGEGCPCRFIDYTTNAAEGSSYGLEAEVNWQLNPMTDFFASLGLLQSEFENFQSYVHVEADAEAGEPHDMSGRDLPQAPHYQGTLGALLTLSDAWYARFDAEAKDAFYFSSRHSARSNAYVLFNARVGYETNGWELAVWGRNLLDEETRVRGFGAFGNDPRNGYEPEPYYQYGEPRLVGVTAKVTF